MRRRHRAREAEAAGHQRPHRRRGGEGELDVLLEVAVVVDVAGRAIRAARQLAQRRQRWGWGRDSWCREGPTSWSKARRGTPARQPSTAARCGTFSSRARGLGLSGRRSGSPWRSSQAVGQRAAEAVAVGAAVDLGGERRRPAGAGGELGGARSE